MRCLFPVTLVVGLPPAAIVCRCRHAEGLGHRALALVVPSGPSHQLREPIGPSGAVPTAVLGVWDWLVGWLRLRGEVARHCFCIRLQVWLPAGRRCGAVHVGSFCSRTDSVPKMGCVSVGNISQDGQSVQAKEEDRKEQGLMAKGKEEEKQEGLKTGRAKEAGMQAMTASTASSMELRSRTMRTGSHCLPSLRKLSQT